HEHHLRHHVCDTVQTSKNGRKKSQKGFTESELNMKACLVPVVYIILVFPS
ncbi:14964_t:CDS:1, partial [Funneliformis mosseae]